MTRSDKKTSQQSGPNNTTAELKPDKAIDCKHIRRLNGLRVCLENRSDRPSRAVCEVCKWRDPKREGAGLGDIVEKVIDVVTFGKGKQVAEATAKAAGKDDCGCAARKAKLNRIGDKLTGGQNNGNDQLDGSGK